LACLTYGADDPARWAAARDLLAEHPELPSGNIWVAAATADADELTRLLAAEPSLASTSGGPFGWPPLLYLTYARHDSAVAAPQVLRAVRVLLDAGADPNAGYLWHGDEPAFTALTGAFGDGEGGAQLQPPHPASRELARLLLERGADPNDGQTLYNRMFSPADDHLEVLFEHGLDDHDALLDQLAWAVEHGFDNRVRLLYAHGVDIGAALHGAGAGGRTAWQLARWTGRTRTAALLEELGFTGELAAEDAVVAAVLAADESELEQLTDADPGLLERARSGRPGLVAWAASIGEPGAVRLAVRSGWDVSARARVDGPVDQEWETALHDAAGKGDLAMIQLLLELGADLDVRDARFDATPQEWAAHFGKSDAAVLLETLRARRK
jgi:hypothetical protein